jgi:stage V sporulation protein SpoVS
MKALILARGYLKEDGFDVVFYPEFVDLDFDGRFSIEIKLIIDQLYSFFI